MLPFSAYMFFTPLQNYCAVKDIASNRRSTCSSSGRMAYSFPFLKQYYCTGTAQVGWRVELLQPNSCSRADLCEPTWVHAWDLGCTVRGQDSTNQCRKWPRSGFPFRDHSRQSASFCLRNTKNVFAGPQFWYST